MSQKIVNFLRANAKSPVVYGSANLETGGCFYRLANGMTFDLSASQCREIGHPRWAFEMEDAA